MGRASYPEQAQAKPAAESHDLTLGMTALLGIFIAVAAVCAVFFGFGYSAARTLHGTKAAAPASSVAPGGNGTVDGTQAAAGLGTAGPSTPPLAMVPIETKPLPGAPLQQKSAAALGVGDGELAQENDAISAAPSRHMPIVAAVPEPAAIAAPGPASGNGGVMVQIAAVVRQPDAEMLATALRANGYVAVVRTEPQDKFLHVQVGPFATRDAAKEMRARLQAAGYNAFLKP